MDTNKTPDCNMREALIAYLYNEATPEEVRRVEPHLKECAACRREMAAFESVRGMLQQWQVDELPGIRVVATSQGASVRSMLELLRELFTATPLWAKAFGAVAMAVLVLAVMGTEVKIGREGFSLRADIMRRGPGESAALPDQREPNPEKIELTRAEVKALVDQMILESERSESVELKAQLVGLESALQNMKSDDLARLAARIQQQQAQIRTLERDIDRREGLDLTDILFSELTTGSTQESGTGAQGGGQ
ncbi:MAG: zf-HC2 domain-containing protein [Blastocatellia bacterium]|nr:zf-HC2 domain-containing protein [Blastocatellia bacterium]